MVIPFSYRWLPCTTQTSTPPYLGCAFPHHWRTGLACRHKTVAKFWPDEVALLYLTTLQQFVLFPQCLIKAILWVLNLLHYISLSVLEDRIHGCLGALKEMLCVKKKILSAILILKGITTGFHIESSCPSFLDQLAHSASSELWWMPSRDNDIY